MRITGAQAVVESLLQEQVELVFGYPGGAITEVYDRLHGSPIRHILSRHEQGAVHAADGYARVTGRPGVVFATSGPGATNLVTGLANAYMDSVPLVAFTGQVATGLIGTDAFQEADITGITFPITKHNYLVKDVRELPRIIKEAFHIATTGRPGPVLVDLPKDVTTAKLDFEYPETVDLPGYKPTYSGHPRQIEQAAQALLHAKRPVLLVGGGVQSAAAAAEVRRLVDLLQLPVTSTLMGLGVIPGDHPLFLGMLGMHGTVAANYAVTECDLLFGVGVRFDDRVTGKLAAFAPHARVIHVDIDPAEIGKNVAADIPIVGDAEQVLRALNARLAELLEARQIRGEGVRGEGGRAERLAPEVGAWRAQVAEWQAKYPLSYRQQEGGAIKPQFVIEQIDELTRGEAIICTEVGQNQMWTAQYYKFHRPRTLISSGGLGTMGFGFPASIGAQLGSPGKVVFDIAGDGSFQMNVQELATAVVNRLPVKVAILNNEFLGMVRQWQALFYDHRYSATCLRGNPDFVKLAEAYGAVGLRAERPEEVRPVLERAMAVTDRPCVLDFRIAREEDVMPMVPPAQPLNRMLGGGEGE
ncbi:MAG TPA: biosynthetic-type acetolactate synthase large subunit [Firmicutes bacterium]|nr:biosynthetic-type acetolactate synthase large subunit [Bacillota bacterium]